MSPPPLFLSPIEDRHDHLCRLSQPDQVRRATAPARPEALAGPSAPTTKIAGVSLLLFVPLVISIGAFVKQIHTEADGHTVRMHGAEVMTAHANLRRSLAHVEMAAGEKDAKHYAEDSQTLRRELDRLAAVHSPRGRVQEPGQLEQAQQRRRTVLKLNPEKATEEEADRIFAEARNAVRDWRSDVADGSKLTLDPELYSYYSMLLITDKLPRVVGSSTRLATIALAMSSDQVVEPHDLRNLTGEYAITMQSLSGQQGGPGQRPPDQPG